ncbi:MAG: pyridoxamine 5'-phosphate oxidase family protein [Clostridiales bacterium]|nr:pyridoxamine 5'-phosphate oxidase family protein [Clostridiales bacterium]
MRRKDRELTDFGELCALVDRCQVVRLAMTDGETPYVVPLSFGWSAEGGRLTLYFHSAQEGRKLDLLRRNPRVCFELDCAFQVLRDDVPCRWGAAFASVIGAGQVEFLTDPAEKQKGLDALMAHYGWEGDAAYDAGTLARTCVYRVTADMLTGKRRQ